VSKIIAEIPQRNLNYKVDNGNLLLTFVKLDTGLLLSGCLHKVCARCDSKSVSYKQDYLQSRFKYA